MQLAPSWRRACAGRSGPLGAGPAQAGGRSGGLKGYCARARQMIVSPVKGRSKHKGGGRAVLNIEPTGLTRTLGAGTAQLKGYCARRRTLGAGTAHLKGYCARRRQAPGTEGSGGQWRPVRRGRVTAPGPSWGPR